LPPKCHAGGGVLQAHGVERPGKAIGKIILCHETVMAFRYQVV
jgi:hypothetical protein